MKPGAFRSAFRVRRSASCVSRFASRAARALASSAHTPFAFRLPQLLVLLLLLTAQVVAAGAWEAQKSGTLAWLRAVYFVDDSRGWAVGSKGALLATTDGGRSWAMRRAPTEDTLRDVYFVSEQTGWLVCDRSIYLLRTRQEPRSYLLRTTDGGASWSRVEVTGADVDVLLTRVAFVDDSRGWAFGEMGALYATTDGGANWERQSVPTKHLLLGGAFLAAGQAWLVGAGNTILYNPDGTEWRVGASPAVTPTRFNAVSFVEARRGWAVGERGLVLASPNGGRSWLRQESNVEVDLSDVKFIDANEGWAVGVQGTIIHTTDGGANWRLEPSGTRHPLERLSVAASGRAWAVGFGGTIINYAGRAAAPRPRLKTPGSEQPKERPRRATPHATMR
ncbi:MAG TPA: YCF48-related protein [Pyrinomonadaceae bacterium]|nr:YCF48-related protein [Pyrinomonadaceae bacterium]